MSRHAASADSPAGKLRVAAVQMRFAPSIAKNLAKMEAAIRRARSRRADLVLFPECATTGYRFDFTKLRPGEILEALAQISGWARAHAINVLAGTPLFRKGRLQNCLVVFDRRGQPVHCYAKCQLTPADRAVFAPGNHIALFEIDGVCCTAIICHERRYPELVRLAAMAGARILFHPNAGLDPLAISRRKRGGRDGIAVRAFENAIHYVFANSVGPQGGGRWSAGDSKIVAAGGRTVRLAGNAGEQVICADLDLAEATGKYARESLEQPRFLRAHWRRMVAEVRRRARTEGRLDWPPTVS